MTDNIVMENGIVKVQDVEEEKQEDTNFFLNGMWMVGGGILLWFVAKLLSIFFVATLVLELGSWLIVGIGLISMCIGMLKAGVSLMKSIF